MDEQRFDKQLAFILEADKEKNILRQTHISGGARQENDAEHAWHMAMMIYLLKEYANQPFDVAKAMMTAIIHDIVEIDAGDTYAYDQQGLKTQKEREEKAANRIFGLLPDDQRDELLKLFHEFEELSTPEARFVKTMDNFQPLLLNNANNGKDWKTHRVNKEQVAKRQQLSAAGSKEICDFSLRLVEQNAQKGNLK